MSDSDQRREVILRRSRATLWLAMACAGLTAVIAVYSLGAWATGKWNLAAVIGGTVPVAPSTALLLVLDAAAFVCLSRSEARLAARAFAWLVTGISAAVAVLVVVRVAVGSGIPLEHWLAGSEDRVRGIPVGFMSPFTGTLFLLGALSLASLQPALASRAAFRTTGRMAILLGLGLSLLTLLAYVTGTPLFYAGGVVPIAFLTALAFLSLNVALALATELHVGTREVILGRSAIGGVPDVHTREQRVLALLTLAFVAVVTVAASFYLRSRQAKLTASIARDLEGIASANAAETALWRADRVRDARLLTQTTALADRLAALISSGGHTTAQADLRSWMSQVSAGSDFAAIAVLDETGTVLLKEPVSAEIGTPLSSRLLAIAYRTGSTQIGDFHKDPSGGIHLEVLSPVFSPEGSPIGAILIELKPEVLLWPLVSHRPTHLSEARILVTQKAGAETLRLGDLESRSPGALVASDRPTERGECIERFLARTQTQGTTSGYNWMGEAVFAASHPVSGSGWRVVAELPQDELYSRMQREASAVALLTIAIICAGTFGAGLLWRRRRSQALERVLAAERARAELGERLSLVMRHANDAILLLDESGCIIEANERAIETYGYTLEELRQLPPWALRAPSLEASEQTLIAPMLRQGGGVFETVQRRKDGSEFPAEISGSNFTAGGRKYLLGVCRDITQRKAHEHQIERLNRIYSALSHANKAIVESQSPQELQQTLCRTLVQHGGFKMAWIGIVDESTLEVRCVADYGDSTGYLKGIHVYASDRPEGRGPTGTSIREKRTYVCNDFFTDPNTRPWREPAAAAGLRASIALPFQVEGRVRGALTVYASAPGFFGEKEIALLEEVSGDLAFGLRHLARESEIRDTTLRLKTLVESVEVAIIVLDRDGHVELWNPAAERMLGWKSHEVIGKNLPTVPPGMLEETVAIHRALFTGQHVPVQETRRLCRDGTIIDVSASFAAMKDETGRVVRTVGVLRDITAQKRAEAEVRRSEARFRALFENSLDGFMLTIPDGRVLAANPAACRMLGRTEAELIRMGRAVIVAEDDDRLRELIDERERTGRASGELTLMRGDGSRFHAELSSSVFVTDEGPRTSLIIHDITERRMRDERIREQAELLDKANEAIIASDLGGRITYWNHGAERLFGKNAVEMAGQPVTAIFAFAGGRAEADLQVAFTRLGDWRGETQAVDRNGLTLVLETSVTVLRDAHGEPIGRLSISTDVTEKKKLEEKFLRSQRLESIGMLAAGIAHDLNNVLAPISIAVPIIREHVTSPMDIRMLNTLEKCAERGAGLARQILGFAHGIGGEPRTVQVKHIVRDIVAVVSETFPKSIAIEDYVPSELWPVLANPTQIHQVLLNLCVNARDAMPAGGTLRLVAENCPLDDGAAAEIEGAKAGTWVVLHVEDSGSGIPPEILPRIWDPFFTTKTADKGTGLGLSTVRGIVESHHGFITVQSQMGRGTTFRIYLPTAEPGGDAEPGASPQVRGASGRGELILVVDDEESIRDTVGTILTRHGYRALVAKDGAEAVDLFASHSAEINLVISDLDMPKLDGLALARIIRERHPSVKILAMSGLPDDARVAEFAPGDLSSGFLRKPFTISTLMEVVRQLLKPGDPLS